MMMMDMGREAVALIHERNVQVVVSGKWEWHCSREETRRWISKV